ncbi:hypothetical protein NFI96_007403 [Prochilodus magdalenae]|nr:hypothetical protein NFI96_007403 [Prochilodus magdalenae]
MNSEQRHVQQLNLNQSQNIKSPPMTFHQLKFKSEVVSLHVLKMRSMSTSVPPTVTVKKKELLGPCTALITPPEPTVAFNNKEPNLKEVETVIKAARSSSAPGPSGVPYVVYKRCPRLLQQLWKIIKVIWRRRKVAQQWRHAEGIWIPKEENASTIEQFRVISLLSVEGKVSKSKGKRRHLVQDEVRAGFEEACTSQMVGMRQQGAQMRWEQALDRKITWSELWKAQPHQINFMVQSVYDVLPSPSNLFCWGLAETPACPLCQRRGSLEHILSCCPKALGEGCYRWRHDQVLRVIADVISTGRFIIS